MEDLRRAVQLSEATENGRKNGLAKEMGETLRRLLQHLTLAILLWLRFCTLPVAYAYCLLLAPNISWVHNFRSKVVHLARTLGKHIPQCIKKHPLAVHFLSKLHNTYKAAFKMCHIARALYDWGQLLAENPDLLNSRHSSSARLSNAVGASNGLNDGMDQAVHHATASQVYHAALATESQTLDDLLASFALSRDASQSGQDRRRSSAISGMDCQRCSQRLRYRNSSIQTTPERMFTPLNGLKENSSQLLQASDRSSSASDTEVGQASNPENAIPDTPSTAKPRLPTSPSLVDLPSGAQLMPSSTDESLVLESSPTQPPQPEGCPREVARQAQSRLPRRRSSPPEVGTESGASMGKPQQMHCMEPATPSKKGKLQRRMRTPRT